MQKKASEVGDYRHLWKPASLADPLPVIYDAYAVFLKILALK